MCAVLAFVALNSFANQDIITAHDSKFADNFGYHAAIDGNTLLVGAHKADIDTVKDAGVAYVYVLGEKGWYQQAKLVAEPFFKNDTLGGNVALKGNVAMLGAIGRNTKAKASGAVIFFERRSNSWIQRQVVTAPDAKSGDAFGQAIALNDSYLVVGSPRNDVLEEDSGAVYIYKRVNEAWRYQTKLSAIDGKKGDLFGISVAISGNTILVGADLHDEKAENAGAVYVYVLDGNKWKQEAKLLASDGGKTDIFGVRVAISGNTALISARRDDIEGIGVDAGSAYIFERHGHHWTEIAKFTSPDGKADDRFGRGVALNEDTAIISAMHHDANGTDTGAVYIYNKGRKGWRYTEKILAELSFPYDRIGWNVALSNNNAVITAPNHDSSGKNTGAVLIQTLNNNVTTR